VPIDLSKIKVPTYFISTIEDHIAPWKSTYSGARNFGGNVRFVLGGSGHIAGIVNPPAANKYGYWTNPAAKLPATADEFFAGAEQHPGSWWTDWQAWLLAQDASKVPARDPVKGNLKVLEDAPGSYVKAVWTQAGSLNVSSTCITEGLRPLLLSRPFRRLHRGHPRLLPRCPRPARRPRHQRGAVLWMFEDPASPACARPSKAVPALSAARTASANSPAC
jgi:hypothetical protein